MVLEEMGVDLCDGLIGACLDRLVVEVHCEDLNVM